MCEYNPCAPILYSKERKPYISSIGKILDAQSSGTVACPYNSSAINAKPRGTRGLTGQATQNIQLQLDERACTQNKVEVSIGAELPHNLLIFAL